MVNLDTLKAGDKVKFRDGSIEKVQKIRVMDYTCTFPYLVFFENKNGEEMQYTKDGFFYCVGVDHHLDIIEIITQGRPMIDVSSINKGDLVTTRDGYTYTVHSIEPNEEEEANDHWADYNITLAQYRGGLYTKDGHYQPDCDDPMDIVAVRKFMQKADQKVIRNHVDLHNIAEGDVVYFEDGSEHVVDDPATFTDSYVILDLDDFGRFKFNYDGTKFEDNAEVGNIKHVLHGAPEKGTPSDNDPVEHPSHYTSGEIECIEAIKSAMTSDAYKGYLNGNILKYLWRYEKKANPVEDLKKARIYLDWLIKEVENVEDK